MTNQIDQLMALADEYATAIATQGEAHDHVARDALRQALEAALKPGEPVAKYIGECSDGSLVQLFDDLKRGTELYTAAPSAQTPPPRLTDDDIRLIETKMVYGNKPMRSVIRAIETAVRKQFLGGRDE